MELCIVSRPEDEATLAVIEKLARDVLNGGERAEVSIQLQQFRNPLYWYSCRSLPTVISITARRSVSSDDAAFLVPSDVSVLYIIIYCILYRIGGVLSCLAVWDTYAFTPHCPTVPGRPPKDGGCRYRARGT